MAEQNYANHTRLVPVFHYVGYLILAVVIAGSMVNFKYYYDHGECLYTPVLIGLICILLLILFWFSRSFALKAQDRAIRAEENLRHFAITGNLLDNRLTMQQIIALRFASNNEFVALAKRAVEEQLTSKQIKQAIQHWKEDNYRV